MSNLPEHGVRLVVKDAPKAIKELTAFDKAVQASNKGMAHAAQQTRQANWFPKIPTGKSGFNAQSLGGITNALQSLNQVTMGILPGLNGLAASTGTATSGLAALGTGAGAILAPIGLAAVAVTGLGLGLFELGKYGASLTPTLQAFGNITGSAGSSTEALQALREQTRGTISDFELMRLATASLQGTTTEFRSIVQEDLGTIIDFTSRVAQATGQSAEVVREKFILGLRRQSRLLLDDVGVVVDKTSARFKELRETMTDEAAYAALAIEKLREVGSELGAPNTVMENLTAGFVFFRNTLDKLAVAIQPAFAPFTEVSAALREQFGYIVEMLFPPMVAGAQLVGNVLSTAFNIAGEALRLFTPGLAVLGEILPYLAALAQMTFEAVNSAVTGIGNVISAVMSRISSAIGGAVGEVNINLTSLAYDVGEGGGRIIGAFAAGLAKGGTYVVKAVTKIAQIVADFLQGFSPPKVGPLSKIDEGGYNIAKAWADGFTKGFINPVEKVAASVEARLGDIGTFTAAQVSTRLATLDTALQPFIDQLDIAKADLEAIAGFVDPALAAIERQRTSALEAFTAGGGDVNALRGLDSQFEALNDFKDTQQSITDNAEIQLALVKAQQAQERALLAIQQRRVGAVQELTGGGGGGVSDALEKAKAAASGGSGGGAAAEGSGGGGFAPGEMPDIFSSEAVEKARANIERAAAAGGKGFQAGIDASGADEAIAALSAQAGELQTQLGRIRSSNPVQKLTDKFSELGTILDDPLGQIKSTVDGAIIEILAKFSRLFDLDLSRLGNVIDLPLDTIKNAVSTAVTFVTDKLKSINDVDFMGLATNAITAIGSIIPSFNLLRLGAGLIKTGVEAIGTAFEKVTETIANALSGLDIPTALSGLSTDLKTALIDPFTSAVSSVITELAKIPSGLGDIIPGAEFISSLGSGIVGLVGGGGSEEGTSSGEGGTQLNGITGLLAFKQTMDDVATKASEVLGPEGTATLLVAGLGTAFQTVTGQIETTLSNFASTGISTALATLPTTLQVSLIDPFTQAAQDAVKALNDAFPDSATFTLSDVTLEVTNNPFGILPDLITFGFGPGQINVGNPFAEATARAKGGVGQGLTWVGENGPELINLKQPTNVFPADVSKAIMTMASSQFRPMASGGDTNNSNSYSTTQNTTTINVKGLREAIVLQRQQLARSYG